MADVVCGRRLAQILAPALVARTAGGGIVRDEYEARVGFAGHANRHNTKVTNANQQHIARKSIALWRETSIPYNNIKQDGTATAQNLCNTREGSHHRLMQENHSVGTTVVKKGKGDLLRHSLGPHLLRGLRDGRLQLLLLRHVGGVHLLAE